MSAELVSLVTAPEGYVNLLGELKNCIYTAQQWAALAVNRELVLQVERELGERA